MSWQKCMSFLKCSILATETAIHFRLYPHKDKRQTMISNKQNFDNEALKVGFILLKTKSVGKFKLKIKLAETKI